MLARSGGGGAQRCIRTRGKEGICGAGVASISLLSAAFQESFAHIFVLLSCLLCCYLADDEEHAPPKTPPRQHKPPQSTTASFNGCLCTFH
jgi:hypothetical protein